MHLYRTYILPVLLAYGCETWTVTKTLSKRLDAFDTWYLRKILRIPYTRHTTNETVRSITDSSPVSERVKYFRLKFFGHLARSAQEEDHHRVISAALRPPSDWRRPIGRPRTTWLRTIDEDIQPQNLGSTRHGGRLGTGRSGIKSSVRQRSVRSSPPRRRRCHVENSVS